MFRRLACLAAAIVLVSGPAAAQTSRGNFSDWHVFTVDTADGLVCYALTQPTDMAPQNVDHGQVFFMVSSWANGQASEQPRFISGYPLRPDNPPLARIGSDRFEMFAADRDGFVEETEDERRLVRAMKAGALMRVEATSTRGTATAYEFSLSGITAALRRVEELC